MIEAIITYPTAELAKEKGFKFEWTYDEDCRDLEVIETGRRAYFRHHKSNRIHHLPIYHFDVSANGVQWINLDMDAPTQSILQKFLRDKEIDITVITEWVPEKGRKYKVGFSYVKDNKIENWFSRDIDKIHIQYDTYEEALEVGLFNALNFYSYAKS